MSMTKKVSALRVEREQLYAELRLANTGRHQNDMEILRLKGLLDAVTAELQALIPGQGSTVAVPDGYRMAPVELLRAIEQTWRIPYEGNPPYNERGEELIRQGLNQLRELIAAVPAQPAQQPTDAMLDDMRRRGLSIDGDNQYKRDLLDVIVGALAFGYLNTNQPPEGHWANNFWDTGRAEGERAEQYQEKILKLRMQLAQQAEQPAVKVPRELLERICADRSLLAMNETLYAINKLRAMLGGEA